MMLLPMITDKWPEPALQARRPYYYFFKVVTGKLK